MRCCAHALYCGCSARASLAARHTLPRLPLSVPACRTHNQSSYPAPHFPPPRPTPGSFVINFVTCVICFLVFSFYRIQPWSRRYYAPRRWVGAQPPIPTPTPSRPRNFRPGASTPCFSPSSACPCRAGRVLGWCRPLVGTQCPKPRQPPNPPKAPLNHHPATIRPPRAPPARYAKDIEVRPRRLPNVPVGWIWPVLTYPEEVGRWAC